MLTIKNYNKLESSRIRDKINPKKQLTDAYKKLRDSQPSNVLNDYRVKDRLDILEESRKDKKRKTLAGGTRRSKTSSTSRFRTTRKVR